MLWLVEGASEEPVSLDEVKLHLRVDGDDEDSLLGAYLTSAREVVERQTGYALAACTYECDTPSALSRLPIEPAMRISEEGVLPVRFTTQPGAVPAALRAAILLLVGDLYENREASVEGVQVNPAIDRLILPYRRFTA